MKNPLLAFVLSFFPGAGMFYLGFPFRGFVYLLGEFGLISLFVILAFRFPNEIVMMIVFLGVILYFINIVDTAITASKLYQRNSNDHEGSAPLKNLSNDQERFYTIVLSFIPGVGHFQLGLMNRGMTILMSFFGLGAMVFFITVLTHRTEFLVFLFILPVIWFFGFFDALQLLKQKEKGEKLVDRSIYEDMELRREDGKKSRSIATFLSVFPGAGHLYLGMQRRGIQLMAAFLLSIYILDVLRLGLFLFLIPIIWFYSFFDGLQMASKYGKEPLKDTPIISQFLNYQKWIGIALIFIGLYYLTSNMIIPAISPMLEEWLKVRETDLVFWFEQYVQTVIVCIILILGGFKLLVGSKQKEKKEERE